MTKKFTTKDILDILPQQPPFMFLDEAEVTENTALGRYKIRGDEYFFKGHFPNNPVFPASLMLEGFGQLAIMLLLARELQPNDVVVDKNCVFFTSADNLRCTRICRPGDVLEYNIKLNKIRFPLGLFEGRITVAGESAAYAEKISLVFDKKI